MIEITVKVPTRTSIYRELTPVQHSVLNVKALVGAFNQEKALVGFLAINR